MSAMNLTSLAPRRLLGLVLIGLIRFYKAAISPFLPATCRYLPTCSAYAIEAIEVHGPAKGGVLAVRRLLRCHPVKWLGGSEGFDPVPPGNHPHQSS